MIVHNLPAGSCAGFLCKVRPIPAVYPRPHRADTSIPCGRGFQVGRGRCCNHRHPAPVPSVAFPPVPCHRICRRRPEHQERRLEDCYGPAPCYRFPCLEASVPPCGSTKRPKSPSGNDIAYSKTRLLSNFIFGLFSRASAVTTTPWRILATAISCYCPDSRRNSRTKTFFFP